jgi:hypothetical protein
MWESMSSDREWRPGAVSFFSFFLHPVLLIRETTAERHGGEGSTVV